MAVFTTNYRLSTTNFFKLLKKLLFLLLIAGLVLVALNFKLVGYGLAQLSGQLNIIWNAQPIDKILNNPATTDTVKNKLLLIQEIKKFAVDSLGLKSTKNYTTFYDQHGKAILMVLSASEKYQLKAYEWKFPVLGNVSYKGFFNFKKGFAEKAEMDALGYDTDYGPTSAWSTLGWFRDPIFSGMLRRNEGELAELIIHEMTHGTIYLESSVDFNENLASVIGEEGAIRFLSSKYGSTSTQMQKYLNGKDDYDHYSEHFLKGAASLDSLYHQYFFATMEPKEQEGWKNMTITQIVSSLDTVQFHDSLRYHSIFSKTHLPNNAYFMGFKRYDEQKTAMKKELREKFNGDFRKYLYYLKEQKR